MNEPLVHPLADVAAGAWIGVGTRMWQVAMSSPMRGSGDYNACSRTLVEGTVTLGDRSL